MLNEIILNFHKQNFMVTNTFKRLAINFFSEIYRDIFFPPKQLSIQLSSCRWQFNFHHACGRCKMHLELIPMTQINGIRQCYEIGRQ